MDNIEHIFEEISKDCKHRLEGEFKGINLIGDEARCKEFLDFFNTFITSLLLTASI